MPGITLFQFRRLTITNKLFSLTALLFILVNFYSSPLKAQNAEIVKIADSVYAFIAEDPTRDYVDGNSIVIITSEGLVVVDTRTDPLSAETEIAEIKKMTSLPVKYIINTHWHYDHTLGNEAFKKAYPNAVIIAHKNCLAEMEKFIPDALSKEPGASLDIIAQYKSELDSGIGGKPLSEYDKSRHLRTIADLELYLSHPLPKYVPADTTFDSVMTINPGGVEIQISRWGNAHTIGDAMIYIPSKKILITGDNVVAPVPYAFGNYVSGQIKVLEQIIELNPDIVVPGHGNVLYDKKYISNLIDLFKSAKEKVYDCYSKGLTVDECSKIVNFDEFRLRFVYDDATAWAFINYFSVPVVRSLYQKELNVK